MDSDYKPSHKSGDSRRSPYPSRPLEGKAVIAEESEEEVSGTVGSGGESEAEVIVEVGTDRPEEMARREESELSRLLRYMREKDERDKQEERERRKEEEEKRRECERVRIEEEERRREAEGARERALEERREREDARRQEELLRRDRRELLQEKLKAMGSYKEGTELVDYLGKFERVMRESEIREAEWSERLFPRLPEHLCARVSSIREDGVEYEELKRVLLKSVGETSLTYGHQLFELTGESLKHKSGGECCEQILRICRYIMQGCMTREQCVVALATACTRRVMPQAGRVFLEGKDVKDAESLRNLWETWMSGRQKGNFFKPRVIDFGGERVIVKTERRDLFGAREITCFSCGAKGHRAADCSKNRSFDTSRKPTESRSVTCYNCGKYGHRSSECNNKKVGAPVKKEGGKVAKLIVDGEKDNIAWGRVNGAPCKVLVDSGASIGVVPRALLGENHRDCGEVHVADVHGTKKVHRSTVVSFEVGGIVRSQLAMIDERQGDGVISIVPMNLMDKEEISAFTKAIADYREEGKGEQRVEAEVNVLTRSQAKAEVELDRCEQDAEVEELWCTVEESAEEDLGDGLDASVVLGEEETIEESLRESVVEDEKRCWRG